MKRRILALLLVFVLVLSALPFTVSAEDDYSREKGTYDFPYLIDNAEEFLNFINENKNSESKVYCKLTTDIIAGGDFKQISAGINAQNIVIDGQGHSVKGFVLNGAMFSSLANSSVRNINFEDIAVAAKDSQAAVIALETDKQTTITNCTFSSCNLDFSQSSGAEAGFAVVNNKGVIRNVTVEDTCEIFLNEMLSDYSVIGGVVADNGYYVIGSSSMLKPSEIKNIHKITADVDLGLIAGNNSNKSGVTECFAKFDEEPVFSENITFNPISGYGSAVSNCYYLKESFFYNSEGLLLVKSASEIAVELNAKLMERNSLHTGEKEDYALLFKTNIFDEIIPDSDGKEAWIKVSVDSNFYSTAASGKEIESATFTPSDPFAKVITNDQNQVQEILTRVGYYDGNGKYIRSTVTVEATCKKDFYSLKSVINQLSYGYMSSLQDVFANEGTNYAVKTFFTTVNTSTNSSKAEVSFSPCNSRITISSVSVNDQIDRYHFDGNGTEKSPFEIRTEDDLDVLRYYIEQAVTYTDVLGEEQKYSNAHYILKNDITLSNRGFAPIGVYTSAYNYGFAGVFDGNFHTIYNYNYYDSTSYTGFFGLVKGTKDKPAIIRNLNVHEAEVYLEEGNGSQRGILAGTAIYAEITGCTVSGMLEGTTQLGGLAGYTSDTVIENCAADVILTSNYVHSWAGGLIGFAQRSNVINSYCFSDITANSVVKPEYLDLGAIAGHCEDSQFIDCYYDCVATDEKFTPINSIAVGKGMYYMAKDSVKGSGNFLSTLKLNADKYSYTSQWTMGTGCFNAYPVPCTRLGLDYFVIPVTSSAGAVIVSTEPQKAGSQISVTLSDNITSVEVTDLGGNKLDLEVTLSSDGKTAEFIMPDRSVRIVPVSSESAFTGFGTNDNPFVINNIDQLKTMVEKINSRESYTYSYISGGKVYAQTGSYIAACFALGENIDGSMASVDSIMNFSGTIDGQGHSVSNVNINGDAIFECLSDSTIKNIIFENIEISGHDDYSAVIAVELEDDNHIMNSTFRNISVKNRGVFGCVSSKCYRSVSSSKISNCYFENVNSSAGIQGYIFGEVVSFNPGGHFKADSCIFAQCSPRENIGDSLLLVYESMCITVSNSFNYISSREVTDEILSDFSANAEKKEDFALWGRDNEGKVFVAGGDNCEISYIKLGVDSKDKAIFTDTNQIKLLDTSRIPQYASEGDKVTLYFYRNTSLVDFRILCKGQKIPYTVSDEKYDVNGFGEITFTMPEGQVILSNNRADTVLIIPGQGTEESPYLISGAEEIKFISKVTHNEVLQYKWYDESYAPYISAHFKLLNDIDMKKIKFGGIGTEKNPFKGVFDGDFHFISSFTLENKNNSYDVMGLFPVVGEKAEVKNLYVENVYSWFGPYAGSAGVIAGINYGIISKCIVRNCETEIGNPDMAEGNYCGFITGYNQKGSVVIDCAVLNNYLRVYNPAGVIVDYARSAMVNYNDGYILNSYAYGNVIKKDASGGYIYGIVSDGTGVVKNCYFNCEDTVADYGGAKSMTKEQFDSGEVAYLLNESITEEGVSWYQNLDNSYPAEKYPDFMLNGENYVYKIDLPFKKCSNFPLEEQLKKDSQGRYLIGSYEDLCVMSVGVNRGIAEMTQGDYLVINSFDVKGKPIDPIGYQQTEPFKGTLNGQGYTISNIAVYCGYGYGNGLFGHCSGKIENLTLDGDFIILSRDEKLLNNIHVGVVVDKVLKNCEINNVHTRVNLDLTQASFVYSLGGIVGSVDNYSCSVNVTKSSCANTYTFNDSLKIYYFGGILCIPSGTANIDSCYVDLKNNPLPVSNGAGGIVGDGGMGSDDNISNSYIRGKFTNVKGQWGPVVGRVINDLTFTDNIYYLDVLRTNNEKHDNKGTPCTESQFASGEVAWLLNKGVNDGTQVWYQNIDNGKTPDDYPVFEGGTVYKNTKCSGELVNYSNTKVEDHHNFNNYNVCTKCIGLKEGKLSGIYSFSIGLGGKINVVYYMVLDEQVVADPESKVVFTVPKSGSTFTEEFLVSEAQVQGKFHIFTCGVSAKEMTSEIKCQVVTSKELEGENDVFTYSVKQYADYILEHSDQYPNAVNVVKAMLNYGAACQIHFDYRTDDLANDSQYITEEEKVLKDCDLSSYEFTYAGYQKGVEYYKSSLVLQSGTDIKHYFYFNNPNDVYDLNITVRGEKVTPLPNNNYHYVRIDDIPVHNFGKAYEVCIGDLVMNYSVLSFGYDTLKNSQNESLKNIVKAMYTYYVEAIDFKAKQ